MLFGVLRDPSSRHTSAEPLEHFSKQRSSELLVSSCCAVCKT